MKTNNKFLVATLAVAATSLWPMSASAQTSVSVYGIIDAGARYASGLGLSGTSSPSASAANTTNLASGVDRSGRFGLSGSEELGDGYKAVFTLETDLYANIGSTDPNQGTSKDTAAANNHKLFERQSFVGLAGPFGRRLLGRQQSALRDISDESDAGGGR